jgi:hypothetical protein
MIDIHFHPLRGDWDTNTCDAFFGVLDDRFLRTIVCRTTDAACSFSP